MAHSEATLFSASVDSIVPSVEAHPALLVVFGGVVASPDERAAGIPPKTQRDAFVNWTEKNRADLIPRMLLPENFPDWSEYNTYQNLLQFEEDLGYLTAAVLIFVEAPGAIAELGAFTQIHSLRDRLAVVVKTHYHPAKSFISLGPLRFLEQFDQQSVCAIDDTPPEHFSSEIPTVMDAVNYTMGKLKPKQSFTTENPGHVILLVLDLVTVFGVIDVPALMQLLAHFQIDAKEARVRQILFALQKAKLLRTGKHGGKYWYWPVERKRVWINYAARGGEPFNRTRLVAKITDWRRSSDLPAQRAHDWAAKGGPK
jgi:hypothetical protein